MGAIKHIFQDWNANKGNPKGRFVVLTFRVAQVIRRKKILFILFIWYLLFYRLIIEWVFCIEPSWKIKAGPNLQLWHGQSLVIHPAVTLGTNCILRQSTTIGVKRNESGIYNDDAPIIGDFVDIGSNSVIIGKITIGDNVVIGAGSVVVKDVPPNSIVIGNPAKIIKTLK